MGQTLETFEMPPRSPPSQDDAPWAIMGRSPWQGQELMQIPCQSCVTSPRREDSHAAPCLLEMALQEPISPHQTHSACLCALLRTALGLWAHYGWVGMICDLHARQLCTYQVSFLPQLSLSSDSLHRPHPLMAMPLLPANASKSPCIGDKPTWGGGIGRTIVWGCPNQTPPDSVRPSSS